jgi:hypothetical protein
MDRFTATPDPVAAGGTLRICFTNANLAGTTVTVNVNNGGGTVVQVDIALNAEGYGCVDWTVPATGWDGILLQHKTSDDHAVPVV